MPRGGDSRFRRVSLVSPRPSRSTCPTRATCWTASTWRAGSPKDSPWYGGRSSAAHPISGPQHTNRTCSEPASRSCAGPAISTDAHQEHLDRLFEAHPRLRTAWEALQQLYQIHQADDIEGANAALGRFADLYATGQIPEYHEIVDTIITWGEEILAYHTSRRASNGPLEGINNLLQVLRRVAHGFTNYDNYTARGLLVT